MKKKYNRYYHVYIRVSRTGKNLVKVGKANNLSRVRAFLGAENMSLSAVIYK